MELKAAFINYALGPTIGAHSGPGTIALFFLRRLQIETSFLLVPGGHIRRQNKSKYCEKTAITIKTRREAGIFGSRKILGSESLAASVYAGLFLHLLKFRLESNAFNPSRLFYIYRIQDWKATHSIQASFFTSIEFGIECVEVFAESEFFLDDTECFTESLEMNNLTLSQEADRGGHFQDP